VETEVEVDESFVKMVVTASVGIRFGKLGSGPLAISRTMETLKYINSLVPDICQRLRKHTTELLEQSELDERGRAAAAYAWGMAYLGSEGSDIADELHKKYVAESN
jgi:hypothetical protein